MAHRNHGRRARPDARQGARSDRPWRPGRSFRSINYMLCHSPQMTLVLHWWCYSTSR